MFMTEMTVNYNGRFKKFLEGEDNYNCVQSLCEIYDKTRNKLARICAFSVS